MEATVAKKVEITKLQRTKLPYLPQDVITEILLLSPARSLGRFRCLSKLFRSLLSDPNFTKKHLDHNAVRSVPRRLIHSDSSNLYAVDFDSICDGCEGTRVLNAVKLDCPLIAELHRKAEWKQTLYGSNYVGTYLGELVEVIGSSNGLVCISASDIFLYNPTTGESKKIPDSPRSRERWCSYGFGFDSLTNDYKVVQIATDIDNYVYSLKKDSWKRICNLPYKKHVRFNNSVELNGAIHWIFTFSAKEARNHEVAAFDLKTETFQVISLPDLTEECHDHSVRRSMVAIGALKGRLCVLHDWCFEMHDDIWVMNEYGLESSWSTIRITCPYSRMKPLCSTKNDEDVLIVIDKYSANLVLYNFKCNTWRNLEIRGLKLGRRLEEYMYVESLISPNSYNIER